jgi:hypothetical protein
MARLVRVALALLCLLTASSASAADAPWCGPNAQSIAAPIIVMPQRDSELAPEKPCRKAARSFDAAPEPTTPERGAVPTAFERMLPLGGLVLIGPKPVRLHRASGGPSEARLGVSPPIYRPPRAA